MLLLIPLVLGLLTPPALGQGGQQCNVTSHCDKGYPCCSDYGFCGEESFCLGGCNPLSSHALDSCRPEPLCKDAQYNFQDPSLSRILSNSTHFDGNSTKYDWVVDKGSVFNTNSSGGELALTLTKEKGGTKISSTKYVHYGTITAKLKTARTAGVVTAFITMSDVKDEIDWEFPGSKTTEAQTNYFWQGVVPEKTNGQTANGLSDTFSNYHDYTIDWQADALTFSIDGKAVRTVKASDLGGKYPSTPSRVQISIWPAGIAGTAQGTIDWAGGMIPFDSDPDYKAQGHFAVLLSSVTIKCNGPEKPGPNMTGYIYTTNDTFPKVALTNHSTMVDGAIGSILAPGAMKLTAHLVAMGLLTSFLMF